MTHHATIIAIIMLTACSTSSEPLGSRAQELADCRAPTERLACASAPDPATRYVCHASARGHLKIAVAPTSAHQPGVAHGNHARVDTIPGASADDNQGTALDCECRPRVCEIGCLADTFDRADGTAIGGPWTELQGDLELAGQALVMAAGATANSWAMADQVLPMDLDDSQLRFRTRLEYGDNWVTVAFNAAQATLAQSGVGALLYGNGANAQDFIRLYQGAATMAEVRPAGLQTGVDYFVTLTTDGGLATLKVTTGGYDGALVHALGPVALAGDPPAANLLVGLDHNAGPSPRLDEVFLDSASCR